MLHSEPGGRYGLTVPGGTLSGLSAGVALAAQGQRLLPSAWIPSDGGLTATLAAGLRLTLRETGGALTLTLRNEGETPVKVLRLFPLIGEAPSAKAIYKQGYQSWSYAGWRPLDGEDIHARSVFTRRIHADMTWPAPRGKGVFQSDGMLLLGSPGFQPVFLAGFLTGARMFGRFEWRDSRLEAWCEMDGLTLPVGASVESEPLMLMFAPEQEALETYAAACGRASGARVPAKSPAVWCSWYYHYTKVRAEDVLEATRALQDMHPTVDVIQLDDGYQTHVGDWLDWNEKFPQGLPWLADQIRAAGFQPGLWLAPFIAVKRSRLFREHPDWFLRDDRGRLVSCGWNPGWNGVMYGLDTTHPDVQEWLEKTIRALVQAGFTYLKLDFLYGATAAGRHYDPTVTRAGALRKGLEIIRRAAGEESFLLGCGCPLQPAVGLVDGMRVGPDVGPTWRFRFAGMPILQKEPGTVAARNALRNALTRQWMHQKLWLNDPDSAILRDRATKLTPAEAQSVFSVTALSGGIFSFSDQPGRLPPHRLDWLRRALPVPQPGFQPLTLLAEEFPFLSVARSGDWALVLAFNAGEAPRRLDLDHKALNLEGEHHVYDCWRMFYMGRHAAGLSCGEVKPHACRVLALRRAVDDQPQLVGASNHLNPAQAAVTRWDGSTLEIDAPAHGFFTVAIPPSLDLIHTDVVLYEEDLPHGAVRLQIEKPGTYQVDFI